MGRFLGHRGLILGQLGARPPFIYTIASRWGVSKSTSNPPHPRFSHTPGRSSVDALSPDPAFFGAAPPLLFRHPLYRGPNSRTHPDSGGRAGLYFSYMEGCADNALFGRSPLEIAFVKSHCNFNGAKSATFRKPKEFTIGFNKWGIDWNPLVTSYCNLKGAKYYDAVNIYTRI